MTLEEVADWSGNVAEINVLYPWHGLEGVMTIVLVIVWIGWHIWQFRMENANYHDDLQTLKQGDNMDRVLKGEKLLRPM